MLICVTLLTESDISNGNYVSSERLYCEFSTLEYLGNYSFEMSESAKPTAQRNIPEEQNSRSLKKSNEMQQYADIMKTIVYVSTTYVLTLTSLTWRIW